MLSEEERKSDEFIICTCANSSVVISSISSQSSAESCDSRLSRSWDEVGFIRVGV